MRPDERLLSGIVHRACASARENPNELLPRVTVRPDGASASMRASKRNELTHSLDHAVGRDHEL
jgi:hypothetical protein